MARWNLSVATSALICGVAFPAIAQVAPQGGEVTTERAEQAPPVESGVGDIVVTAQRRAESVQRASLSIEAITSDALQARGVSDSQSLNDVVPGLKIAYTGGQVQTFVRGVGDAASNAYTQSSVSLNMDGVYIARSSAFGSVFFDTARVEVLRGPQGTLYGRNSSGGAINIISNAPTFEEFGGYVVGEVGNYDLFRVQGAVNAPVSDTFAIRAAAQVVRRDGYLSDGANDEKSESGRLRALWKPSQYFSLSLIGEIANIGGNGYGRVYRPVLFGDPWVGAYDPRIVPPAFPATRARADNYVDTKFRGVTAEMNWDLGFATFTVLPAYRHVRTDNTSSTDFVFAELDDSHQTSLEGRLSGDSSFLKWVVGIYGFKEDLSVYAVNDQRSYDRRNGNFQIQDIDRLDTKAWAVFGEATASVSDAFRLIGGLRYTEESRRRVGTLATTTFTNGAAGPTGIQSFNATVAADAITWRVGAEFDAAPQSMLYASVSKGFKTGGFDATGPDAYFPEYVTAYTLGSKNRFLDNKLQVNLEAFYWKYADQQIAFLGVDTRGITSFITRNAGQSTIWGGNLDIVARPTDNDTIDAGVEYLRTNYDDFRFNAIGNFAAGTALADGCVSDGPVAGGPGQFIQNCSGRPLPRAPLWSGNVRYSHRFDLSNGADLTFAGTMKFQSSHYLQLNYVSPNFFQDAYQLFDADITYRAPEGRWSLSAYVRNIGNEAVYLTASNANSVTPATGVNRVSLGAIGAPRTFGARFQFNF